MLTIVSAAANHTSLKGSGSVARIESNGGPGQACANV